MSAGRNKVTRRTASSKPALRVAASGVHGLGAFAARPLPAGTFLGFYEGRRYSAVEAAGRDWDGQLSYLAMLSSGEVIDGAEGGNATRFLNHSCEPNCVAFEDEDEAGRAAFRFQTLRAIAVDAELFVDYGLEADDGSTAADHPCRCGAARCRGTLLAPD